MAQAGRNTQAYASAYQPERVSVGRVRRRTKRQVVANFNGALAEGRTIESATWHANSPWVTFMSAPEISADQRQTSVNVDFQLGGYGSLRAEVTLDDGSIESQLFDFQVRDWPWFDEEPPVVGGPFNVTVTA